MLDEGGGEKDGDLMPTGAFILPFSAVEDLVDVGITVRPNSN